jgi:PPK2 family polyphosphate:nucleotide phosphotransferase
MHTHRVEPDKHIHLKDFDANDSSGFSDGKEAARQKLLELSAKIDTLQERMYAEGKHRLLVILQGMDTSGKDGTVRSIFEGTNPQGVRVVSFKVPSPEELDHDYLWRIHKETPARGEIVIFNRSHYEDVLVVRVHKIVPEEIWKRRYDEINAFEHLLAAEGTTIVKFFLHIDLDEQKQRLIERLDDPAKHWKFNPGDLKERLLWKSYQEAYEDVLNKTSTDWAPWYIVPANKKWYRNLVIGSALVSALEQMNIQDPPKLPEAATYKAQLLAEPPSHE